MQDPTVAGGAQLPSALSAQDSLFARLAGRGALVFLDYDGTLAPIAERPEAAEMPEAVRDTVAALARRCTVAIISGRALDDVRRRVGIPELHYAGNHGLEIDGPRVSLIHEMARASRDRLQSVLHAIERATESIPGVLVEDKQLTLSVHYRLTPPERRAEVGAAVSEALVGEPDLHANEGKCLYEIRPRVDWHKGAAVEFLREQLDPRAELLPFYLGDDRTDEDAFEALREAGVGILIAAGDRPSAAAYRLADPVEVGQFLGALERRLAHG